MIRPIWPVLRLLLLAWWKWAHRELQARDPHHPDLYFITHRINQLERS